jgi:2-polyprenyl-3-methyl-5-hydroxy-6-metoxy-1,4-benzoquinol methylase
VLAVAREESVLRAKQCPLCGSDGREQFALHRYQIRRCRACGTEFNASFIGGGADGQLFDCTYYEVRHKEAFEVQFEDYRSDPSAPVFLARLHDIEARIGVGTVLDVGSGLGTFLRLARDNGWDAEGVEVSAFAARFARETHRLRIFTGDLTAFAESTRRTFDVITFWDSIEHVGDPRLVIEAAQRLLRPGGLVVIATDNFDCLVGDIAVALYRLSRGRIRYPLERVFIEQNRTYFTEQSLRRLLQRLQLEVVFFEKMEYPLRKIKTTVLERIVLLGIYGMARLSRRQAQVTLFAVKS